MHRGGRHCFWLRLAVIAAAAAFVKANAHSAYVPGAQGDGLAAVGQAGSSTATSIQDAEEPRLAGPKEEYSGDDSPRGSEKAPDSPPKDDRTSGSAATFIAVRPEVQDLNGASMRRLCPREPVSGLHQPVITPQAMQHLALAFEAERPSEPDLIREIARPIVRHGPPYA